MHSPIITVMSAAAIKAGKNLLRDFGEVSELQISRKGTADFVTQSDLRTEKKLVNELRKARPDYGFLLEESGEVPGADESHRWIIDPLDGTSNFIHAQPFFCISIGLEQRHKNGGTEIIAGVIYDPLHNELFYAEKNKGAYVNDRRLAASARDRLDEAMIATGSRPARDEIGAARLKRISEHTGFIRNTGSAALDLAYVAAGRLEGCWFASLKPWDMAAGLLFIREAGGISTDFSGNPSTAYTPSLLAANRHLHGKLLKLLAG